MIFPKPSNLCGLCKEYKEKCFCACHVLDLTNSYHEEINIMPTTGKVEDITKYEDEPKIDITTFTPIKH